jgi:hypothetical protein
MPIDIEKEFTLLMTASIDPKGMSTSAAAADPNERQDDYAASLSYYLTEHPRVRRITFVENSGWPLDRLRATAENNPHRKSVEFISLSLNDFSRSLGKGYGELLMLDECLQRSTHVRESRYFGKLTGRIRLLNLTSLLEALPDPIDFACDLRDHPFYDLVNFISTRLRPTSTHRFNGRWGESRFFVTTPDFYHRHLRGRYAGIEESRPSWGLGTYYIEGLIFQIAKNEAAGERVVRRFPIEPMFRGMAGHLDKDYGGFTQRVKHAARSAVRRLAPWLHI